jgi:hypothetical protein
MVNTLIGAWAVNQAGSCIDSAFYPVKRPANGQVIVEIERRTCYDMG